MDNFRDLANELEPAFGSHAPDLPDELDSSDERRMQVRAYNYWASLLAGRDFPSIEDLEPSSIADFAKHSVLLDFTTGPSNATAAYVGATLRRECDMDSDSDSLADVAGNTLLARLVDYYPQILDSRVPVGVEVTFTNQRGQDRCYRGILMPFSSDGDTIDFVYGVFNWSDAEVAEAAPSPLPTTDCDDDHDVLELAEDDLLELSEEADTLELTDEEESLDQDDAAALEPDVEAAGDVPEAAPPTEDAMRVIRAVLPEQPLELAEGLDMEAAEPEFVPAVEPAAEEIALPPVQWNAPEVGAEVEAEAYDEEEAELVEWLVAARATAEDAKAADGRSRQALYRALAEAYDFACAAADAPDEYQRLMEDSGIVPQARAPMTPVVKLVFGADHDKARLTEYAAALSYASRQGVERGGFLDFIEGTDGGLKGLVEAERQLRRPEGQPAGDWRERVATRLRTAEPRPLDSLAGNGEFALVLVRRDATGAVAPIAAVSDAALLDKALKKAAH